jgi:hypothetical protein
MHLYHISDKRHPMLLPLRLQTGKTKKELNNIDRDYSEYRTPPYTWSLSFFFDPPPYGEFKYHYSRGDRWEPTSTLYEHTIEVSNIPQPIYWRVVESPINTTLGSIFDDISRDKWFKLRWKLLAKTHHMGFDTASLQNMIKLYQGSTGNYYRALWASSQFKEVKDHYAPNVPHSMLWVKQPIIVSNIRSIQI